MEKFAAAAGRVWCMYTRKHPSPPLCFPKRQLPAAVESRGNKKHQRNHVSTDILTAGNTERDTAAKGQQQQQERDSSSSSKEATGSRSVLYVHPTHSAASSSRSEGSVFSFFEVSSLTID